MRELSDPKLEVFVEMIQRGDRCRCGAWPPLTKEIQVILRRLKRAKR